MAIGMQTKSSVMCVTPIAAKPGRTVGDGLRRASKVTDCILFRNDRDCITTATLQACNQHASNKQKLPELPHEQHLANFVCSSYLIADERFRNLRFLS